MAVHHISDSDWAIFKELVYWWRNFNKTSYNKNPSLPNDIDDILTPEVYIARTPPEGIPALVQSSSLGTGAEPTNDPDRPGSAFCYIYRILEDDFGVERLYPIGSFKKVYNLLGAAIPGRAWFTPIRTKQGKWLVPAQGFNFRQCDEVAPGTGTGTGTGTGGGSSGGNCFSGLCGDTGVHPSLTATITNKMGCFATFGDTLTFNCVNSGSTHTYDAGSIYDPCTNANYDFQISALLYPSDVTPVLSNPWVFPISPQSGWTCQPFSAVYLINLGGGDSCTITVIS